MADGLTITIDADDWLESFRRTEGDYTSKEAMIATHMQEQQNVLKTGRDAIVARELGIAPSGIVPPNDLLLASGAGRHVTDTMNRARTTVEINGREWEVCPYVGAVRGPVEGDDDNGKAEKPETYISVRDLDALDRSMRYLLNIVPGHVMGRLKIIAFHGGDYEDAVEQLKAKIDDMILMLGEEETA